MNRGVPTKFVMISNLKKPFGLLVYLSNILGLRVMPTLITSKHDTLNPVFS